MKALNYYSKLFKDLLAHNKRELAYSEDDEYYVVLNNAWKAVTEWELEDVVAFLYKHRDFQFIMGNQRRKFRTPTCQSKRYGFPLKWFVDSQLRPVKMWVPLASLKEDE